jgi:hypothetical protein
MKLAALIAIAACAVPPPGPAPGPAPPAAAPDRGTDLPALGLRIGCAGHVQITGGVALVDCGGTIVSITIEPDARTIDDAIAAHRASASYWLEAAPGEETRGPDRARYRYENRGAAGTNYWVDVILAVGGRIVACQAGSIGEHASRAAADAGGALCETIVPLRTGSTGTGSSPRGGTAPR